jgi:Skp family chaperone for outer membrane proteins
MQRLSSASSAVTVILLFLAGPGRTEETGRPPTADAVTTLATPAGTPVKIGVVDLEQVEADTLLGKEYARRIKTLEEQGRAEGARRQQALAKLADDLLTQTEALRRDQERLAPEELEARQQRLTRGLREREAAQQDAELEMGRLERKLQRDHEQLRQELRQRLLPFVETVIRQRGLDVIFDRRACIAVSREIDVTDDVIRAADEARRPEQGKAEATPQQ